MAHVYAVRDESTGERHALKQHRAPAAKKERRASELRFRREYHSMAGLVHPRIVRVHDFGIDEGTPYYLMELLDGSDLRDLAPLGWREAAALIRDVALALAFVHARGLVHRDVAPRNVRCTRDGRAKLIDFGVLASAGIVGDIAGTPSYVAPEMLRFVPLDGRGDLFSLGALAYHLLTGTSAFAVKALDELWSAWQRAPAPPSEIRADVPREFDELVLALLSIQPEGRPSVEDIVDRLTHFAELEPVAEDEAIAGYFGSAAFVGREQEMARLRAAIERGIAGRGGATLIQGRSGMGKSRLLQEAALEGALMGATVIRVRGDDRAQEPYGLLRSIASDLSEKAPVETQDAARPWVATVARAIPELARESMHSERVPRARDPAEQRMQLQAALGGWLGALAETRPFLITIDDIQRGDEPSLAVLASVMLEAAHLPLSIVGAFRKDEEPRAPHAFGAIANAAGSIELRGLSQADLGRLVEATFGGLEDKERLVEWALGATGGSPMLAMQLLRSLVDTRRLTFADGAWHLEDLERAEVPRGLSELLDARVAGLPRESREIAEIVAVFGGEIGLSDCVALSTAAEDSVFSAVDQLAAADVVIATRERVSFRHDGFREAVLRSIAPDKQRLLHLRIGQALLARHAERQGREGEVGWHLIRGGESKLGAELLASAGRRLYQAQSFAEARAPLEAALEVFAEDPALERRTHELSLMLLVVGTMTDRDLALRHADETVASLCRAAGLDVALSASRWVGSTLGLALGVMVGVLRWIFFFRGPRGPNPIWLAENAVLSLGIAASVYSLGWDVDAVRALHRRTQPIRVLGHHGGLAVDLLTENLLNFPLGLLPRVRENTDRVVESLERAKSLRLSGLSELDIRIGQAGAHLMHALADVAEQDPRYESTVEAIEKLDLRFFDLGVLQARLAFHRSRGEEPRARELERAADRLLIQLGSAWQMQAWLSVVSALAYGMCGDALGLRRGVTRLETLCSRGFRFDAVLALTHGEYLRLRGDLEGSRAALERALELAGEELRIARLPALPALAETLLASGALERAKACAELGVRETSSAEYGQRVNLARSQRVLALVEAELGEVDAARERLDRAIAEAEAYESPIVLGSLYEAGAKVARLAGDAGAASVDAKLAETWFGATQNPVLVDRARRVQSVLERDRRPMPVETHEQATVVDAAIDREAETLASLTQAFADCAGRRQRIERALDLLIRLSGAERGFLYLVGPNGPVLEAPSAGVEPARELASAVEAWLAEDERAAPDGPGVVAAKLEADAGSGTRTVGGVVLFGARPSRAPPPAVASGVARHLLEAGDLDVITSLARERRSDP